MSDLEEDGSSRFDNIDLDSILGRVERRGPLTFTKKRCLYRAKSRSSKKASSRTAHKRSMFPPITEKVAEEELEAEETKRSPESPLTHLYYGLTWKNRDWSEFLGSWAFVNGVNSKDFDGLSDSFDDCSDDEDDVFISDDSLNDTDTDFDAETDTTSQPESDGYYGNDTRYNSDLPESLNGGITIPNLVFENKNLVRSKGHADLSCFTSTRPLTFAKDENANKKILPNDNSHLCNNVTTAPPSDHISDSFKSEPETTSATGDNSHNKIDKLDLPSHSMGINWSEICLMLSGSTSVALFMDVPPHVFIFSIIISQLLYILIRFLLNPE